MRILVAEDEPKVGTFVKKGLELCRRFKK